MSPERTWRAREGSARGDQEALRAGLRVRCTMLFDDEWRVVFLDIDGVLNSGRNCMRQQGKSRPFDPDAITAINHILEQTGATVVVSSTWRIGRSVAELDELMTLEGLPRGC